MAKNPQTLCTYGKIQENMTAEKKQLSAPYSSAETGASSSVLGKIEKHYFPQNQKPRTDELAALDHYTVYLEDKESVLSHNGDRSLVEMAESAKRTLDVFREDDEYNRKSVIAEYFAKSLAHAYGTENVPATEAQGKVTDVFIGVRDRLQNHTTGEQIPAEGTFIDRSVKAMDRWMKNKQEKFWLNRGYRNVVDWMIGDRP